MLVNTQMIFFEFKLSQHWEPHHEPYVYDLREQFRHMLLGIFSDGDLRIQVLNLWILKDYCNGGGCAHYANKCFDSQRQVFFVA